MLPSTRLAAGGARRQRETATGQRAQSAPQRPHNSRAGDPHLSHHRCSPRSPPPLLSTVPTTAALHGPHHRCPPACPAGSAHQTGKWWRCWRGPAPAGCGSCCAAPAGHRPQPAAGPAGSGARPETLAGAVWPDSPLKRHPTCKRQPLLTALWAAQAGPSCGSQLQPHPSPTHRLGQAGAGVRQDSGHAAVVGAAQEEGERPRFELVRCQRGGRRLGLEARVGRRVAPHHQLLRGRWGRGGQKTVTGSTCRPLLPSSPA